MEKDNLLVRIWDKITKVLLHFSVLQIIIWLWRKHIGYDSYFADVNKKKENGEMLTPQEEEFDHSMSKLYGFIDLWVIGNTFFAAICLWIICNFLNKNFIIVAYMMTIYGMWRIFEIIIKQIRVILFDTIGNNAISLRDTRRSIILLFHNVFEVILWFAVSFSTVYLGERVADNVTLAQDGYSMVDFITHSMLLFTVFGDEYSSIQDLNGMWLLKISSLEVIVGFMVIVFSVARFMSLLPNVKVQSEENCLQKDTVEEHCKEAVVENTFDDKELKKEFIKYKQIKEDNYQQYVQWRRTIAARCDTCLKDDKRIEYKAFISRKKSTYVLINNFVFTFATAFFLAEISILTSINIAQDVTINGWGLLLVAFFSLGLVLCVSIFFFLFLKVRIQFCNEMIDILSCNNEA